MSDTDGLGGREGAREEGGGCMPHPNCFLLLMEQIHNKCNDSKNTNILSYNSGGQKSLRLAGCIPSGGSRGRIHPALPASRGCPQFLAGVPPLHFQNQQWPVGQGAHHVGDNSMSCELP